MSQKTKLIIDTDPGIDDAMAILAAFNCHELEVLGLTTIYGNVPTTLATENALRLIEVAGASQVEVAQGSFCSLKSDVKEVRIANFVHGEDGFGDIGVPPPKAKALSGVSAAEFIVRKINQFPGEVSILALAGLTNIAQAIMLDPSIASKWKDLVILGGAFFVNGNINPAAEANIFADPDAADFVFGAGERIRVIGLDVTHECCLTGAELDELGGVSGEPNGQAVTPPAASVGSSAGADGNGAVGLGTVEKNQETEEAERAGEEKGETLQGGTHGKDAEEEGGEGKKETGTGTRTGKAGGRFGKFVRAISQFYLNYHRRAYNMDAIYLHDPTALVALIRPDLFRWRQGAVRVACEGVARGCTIMDANLKAWHGDNPWLGRPKVHVALEVCEREVVQCILDLLNS